ncbi:hypothetical protein [Leptothermofonsia sp. ETS-13]|uniref:hypothetical protein n=1 Tax=Leptothermofonsia sp. ETS-13 TaxID=3035696 RepID=UPI003BA2C57E
MNQSNPVAQENSGSKSPIPEDLISSYEMAVLSTLFEQEDSHKVTELAEQWGYQQEFLYSVWKEIHANIMNRRSPPPSES